MSEADDTRAVEETGGTVTEPVADEISAPAEGVAVPQQSLEIPDGDAVRVPDDAVAVPEVGLEPPEVALEPPDGGLRPPDVTLEPPKVSMPPLPETGESRVDAAVAPLRDLGEQPTEEHVAGYEAAHTGLQDVLADLDRDPDGST